MQTAICTVTGKAFPISDKLLAFCQTHDIPLPTLCLEERMHRAYSFSNAVYLYNTTCALSKKNILSWIPPDKGFVIYDIDEWMSDKWDGIDMGQEIDWNRPFLEQVAELQKKVPAPNLIMERSTLENSDYCNGVGRLKNCYLTFVGADNEDCLFASGIVRCKNIIDSVWTTDCELCFDCYQITNCYNLRHSEQCANSSDSSFLFNCRSVKNSFGCVNLRNKEYCWYNEQLTKEEYEKRLATFRFGSFSVVENEKKKFVTFKKKFPIKYMFGNQNENSTGNEVNFTKNCDNCFFTNNAEDVENGVQLNDSKDSIDFFGFGMNAELVYCCMGCGDNANNLKFCLHCYSNVHDLEYCIYVGYGSNNCFGCVGLKKKQYCILNKQYTKAEYEALIPRIKEHMKQHGEYGQFFPPTMSYCHYNQSEGNMYCPMTKAEAIQKGYSWMEESIIPPTAPSPLPDDVHETSDDIIHTTLECALTGKKYRLIKQELAAYKQFSLPVPRLAPLERIKLKLNKSQILPLQTIHCHHCQKELASIFNPREQEVLCEECFVKNVQE